MKHQRFIKKWRRVRADGFLKFIIMNAIGWLISLLTIVKGVIWYLRGPNLEPNYYNLLWEVPAFLAVGACFGLILWIVNNYLYAKYTGEFTPDDHHH